VRQGSDCGNLVARLPGVVARTPVALPLLSSGTGLIWPSRRTTPSERFNIGRVAGSTLVAGACGAHRLPLALLESTEV